MKKDIRTDLAGFNITWLANNVTQPDGTKGISRQRMFQYLAGKRSIPEWLIEQLKGLTKRAIK